MINSYAPLIMLFYCALLFVLALFGDDESFGWLDVLIVAVCIAILVCISVPR